MPDIRRTGVLDDCQRADEHPLSFDGRWRKVSGGPSNWNYFGQWHLCLKDETISYSALTHGTLGSATFVSYWALTPFNDPVEVWGRSGAGFDLTEGWRLFLNLTLPETHPLMRGYELSITSNIGSNTWTIAEFSPAKADLNTVEHNPLANNELALFRYESGTLSAWRDNNTNGATWQQILTASDSSSPFGYIGIGTDQDDDNPGWIEFGGGTIRRTQIYRRVTN